MPSESTLFTVCSYLKNWFDRKQVKHIGTVTIENGALVQTYGLKPNQYFRIIDSPLNTGIYQYPTTSLKDETFDGAIWGMAIPPQFLELCDKIEAWRLKYEATDSVVMSPFNSESVSGVYSYSKSSGGNDTSKDKSGTWQGVFGAALSPWRKM